MDSLHNNTIYNHTKDGKKFICLSGPSKPNKIGPIATHNKAPNFPQDTRELPEEGYKILRTRSSGHTSIDNLHKSADLGGGCGDVVHGRCRWDAGRERGGGQAEILQSAEQKAAKGRRESRLDSGP